MVITMGTAEENDLTIMQKALDWVKDNRRARHTLFEFERRATVVGTKMQGGMVIRMSIQSGSKYWFYSIFVKGDEIGQPTEYQQ